MLAELKKILDEYGPEFVTILLLGWFLKYREDQNQIERNRLLGIIEKLLMKQSK